MAEPTLTTTQKDAILASAAELIAASAAGRAPTIADPSLADAYSLPVAGVFVTLKRRRHLRGCTGGLRNQPVLLGEALVDAVEGTVHRDVRFPPISIGEVVHLDLDVWLLSEPEKVVEQGEDRIRAVEVGRHGLVMNRGDKHGLLLPGVPVEHGWDAKTFLEQTCVKAGLHPSLWKDDATTLLRFGGESFGGPLSRWLKPEQTPPLTDRTELGGFYDFCWDNIVAAIQGATPRYFHPGLRDLRVNGAILRLRLPGNRGEFQMAQISLRPALHAQNLLLQLGQSAATALAQRGVRVGNLGLVGMGLTLLGDPQLLGAAGDPGDVEAGRAILVSERQRQAVAHQPESPPSETLARAIESAHVRHPQHAVVFSLQAFSTDRSVVFTNAPKPRRGPADRPSGVAGSFYPVDPNALRETVDGLLARSKEAALPKRSVPAAMVPHAGLRFSGAVAAQVLQSIELPGRILVLGPKHTPHGMDWAVAPHEKWRLPSGEMASDFMLARKLNQAIPGLEMDAAAHEKEHAIEVELPLLMKLAPLSPRDRHRARRRCGLAERSAVRGRIGAGDPVAAGAAALVDFERHESLRQRCRDAPARCDCTGSARTARPGGRARDDSRAQHQHVRRLSGGHRDGDAAALGAAEESDPLRICDVRGRDRRDRSRRRLCRDAVRVT